MQALEGLRVQARANRLANRRLHAAMAALPDADFHAPRTGFFPSLAATLNHVLEVDGYYIGALAGEADLYGHWDRFVPAKTLAELASRQAASDERLIALVDAMDEAASERIVEMPRRDHVQRDRAAFVLLHLFMHQTHHRGQAHGMLSGTAVAPPQLDEFLMPSDAPLRRADMAALGWDEALVYGRPPAGP
ncbi:MAG: DinB family protein [Rubrivivax sp.]|nr:DinB family protein [Rubrivivax sp.]